MFKKGDATLIWVIIGLIIGGIVTLILIYTGNSLLSLIASQDNSEDFFNEFVENTEIVSLSGISKELLYFVGEDSFLIGFPEKNKDIEGINRPDAEDKCGGESTCFCLCQHSNDADSCLRSTSKCIKSDNYEMIKGIVIDENKIENENLDGLLIKGRTKLLIVIGKKDNTLIVKTTPAE